MSNMRTIVFCCLLTFSVAQEQVNQIHNQNDMYLIGSFVAATIKNSSLLDNFTMAPQATHPTSLDTNPLLKTLTTNNLGYELTNGWLGWYKIHTDEKNWSDAQEVCLREGANLLVINSRQEAEAIRSLLEKTRATGKYYWIGFHDFYEQGNYVTIFNESLNSTGYADWGQNEPDGRPGEDCGVFGNFSTNEYGLGDFLCSVNMPYICEEKTVIKEKNIQTSQQEIASLKGYELIAPLGYYRYHQHALNWQDAVDVCSQEGGHLVIINSQDEALAMMSLGHRYRSTFDIWTGAHDKYQEGNFVTIFNHTLQSTGYTTWYPGHPANRRDMNCLRLLLGSSGFGLYDNFCTNTQYFICEYEL